MRKYFNITGSCDPAEHYMVDISSRLKNIKELVDEGKYFTINRGRQYGKTTTLEALAEYLKNDHTVIHLDFQRMSNTDFQTEEKFTKAFTRELWLQCRTFMEQDISDQIKDMKQGTDNGLADLFTVLSEWCGLLADKPAVLIIDEVDNASNNQVFLDFLAQLRYYYLNRRKFPTFKSVILAGVHDIRSLKQKIRPDEAHTHNSPWNIAASFDIDMSFSAEDISGMLDEYEKDNSKGIDIQAISQLIYDYTSGYPVLVSTLCKYMDEEFSWTNDGFSEAVKKILVSDVPLFESLINKTEDHPILYEYLYQILINGKSVSFSPDDPVFKLAKMYGFIAVEKGTVKVANRIFETRLYNYILTSHKMQSTPIFNAGANDKNQFISNGQLDMDKIFERYLMSFNFNKNKKTGIHTIQIGDKTIVEGIV